MPTVEPALIEEGVIIPELGPDIEPDKRLFEALRNNLPLDEQQTWRALLQAGYLTVVEMKDINEWALLVLKPPTDRIAAVVRAGIFEMFDPALCNAVNDDDLAKLVTDTAAILEKGRV